MFRDSLRVQFIAAIKTRIVSNDLNILYYLC